MADGGYNDIVLSSRAQPCVSGVGHCPCSSGVLEEPAGGDAGTPILANSAVLGEHDEASCHQTEVDLRLLEQLLFQHVSLAHRQTADRHVEIVNGAKTSRTWLCLQQS